MSQPASNVRVISNVFPICTESAWADPQFRRQVRGRAALKKLAEYFCGQNIYERETMRDFRTGGWVEPWQIEIYWLQEGSGGCANCPPGEKPYGVVRVDNEPRVVCRCRRQNCPDKSPRS